MIALIILFSIAGTNLIWSIIISAVTKEEEWLWVNALTVFLLAIGLGLLLSTPTNSSVKNKEAHYVEQNHIEVVNGDTINTYKTYQIEWNQNTK